MYFTLDIQNYGETIPINLVPNGDKVKLCQQNKREYVYRICEYFLDSSIEKQFTAFKRGFDKVVDTELIKVNFSLMQMFRPDELEIIITGTEVIDFKELEANAQY